MASREVINVDIAFARLELLELDHGKRTLTQCPGIKAMAAHIREAERALADEPEPNFRDEMAARST